jgi:cytosine/adenosine deaminase-related metal-dependent hydrolase
MANTNGKHVSPMVAFQNQNSAEVRMLVITGAHIATADADGTEHSDGYVVIDGNLIVAVGAGSVPEAHRHSPDGSPIDVLDATGMLVTPGLVNTHQHLYQWITRGYATDTTLFGWLTTLYPIWARIDAQLVHDSAAANLAWLALTGCSTSTDHHYVFPRHGGDLLQAEIEAAALIGLRFHPTRGSMNLGVSAGGLPPDSVVEEHDEILAATSAAISRWHDASFGSMLQIAVAPCSPFSVTAELMRDSAALAREKGVRLHTHLAETADEDDFCRERFGRTPAEYAEDLGWLGPDVWLAHCVHLSDDAVARFAATGTGVAHCPTSNGRLGAGAAPIQALLAAGAPVGLGVDGAASNESGRMVDELHQSLLTARIRNGPTALNARQALAMATSGGARCLGRQNEIGSLEPGKLADVAIWDVGGLPGAGIVDPVVTLVFGAPTLAQLYVNGAVVVADGRLHTADEETLAAAAGKASAALRPDR